MRILILITLFFTISLNIFSNTLPDSLLNDLRKIYYAGVEHEEYIDSLKNIIKHNFGNDKEKYPSLILAYSAGIEALKSKHAFLPFNKLSYLNESMEIFEEAVKREPNNLEIRFMRYSILYYVPGILGYDDVETEDLKAVYELLMQSDYSKIAYDIQKGMVEFVIQSEQLNQSEIENLLIKFGITLTNE